MKELTYYRKLSQDRYVTRTHLFMWKEQFNLLRYPQINLIDNILPNSKVYFARHVDFPRFKFKNWGKKDNIKVKRNIEHADIIIIDLSKLKFLERFGTHCLEKVYKEYWEELFLGDPYGIQSYEIVDEIIYRTRIDEDEASEMSISLELYNFSDFLYKYQIDVIEECTELFKDKNLTFIDYSVFCNIVSPELAMDMEGYRTITDMLSSNDRETVELAAEMLTNYNFEESKFYFYCINTQFSRKLRESDTWNKITFKPVRHAIINSLASTYWYDLNRQFPDFLHQVVTDDPDCIIPRDFVYSEYKKYLNNNINLTDLNYITDIQINFDLNSSIFPKERNINFEEKNEQEEQNCGSQLGEDLQEYIDESLSLHSNEQE